MAIYWQKLILRALHSLNSLIILVATAHTIYIYIRVRTVSRNNSPRWPGMADIRSEVILLVVASLSMILAWFIIWGYGRDRYARMRQVSTGWSLTGWGFIAIDVSAWLFGGGFLLISSLYYRKTSLWATTCLLYDGGLIPNSNLTFGELCVFEVKSVNL